MLYFLKVILGYLSGSPNVIIIFFFFLVDFMISLLSSVKNILSDKENSCLVKILKLSYIWSAYIDYAITIWGDFSSLMNQGILFVCKI